MSETDIAERSTTADRLPTREQIESLEDIDSLTELLDKVVAASKQIEVDLEFRSDDAADEFWEHRARKALTAHHICNGNLTRRIAFLRRGSKPGPQGDPDAKARKREAAAQLLAAQTEAKRAKVLGEREKTHRQMIDFAARQSLLLHFHKVASQTFDHATMQELMAKAHASLEASLSNATTTNEGE